MTHAYPHDELMPLSRVAERQTPRDGLRSFLHRWSPSARRCKGRRWDKRERGTLDDSLGGYLMTLVDGADTMLVVGDAEAFGRTLDIVTSKLSFDRDVAVSTFEACIRVLGGLLSAHYLVTERRLRPVVRQPSGHEKRVAAPPRGATT